MQSVLQGELEHSECLWIHRQSCISGIYWHVMTGLAAGKIKGKTLPSHDLTVESLEKNPVQP